MLFEQLLDYHPHPCPGRLALLPVDCAVLPEYVRQFLCDGDQRLARQKIRTVIFIMIQDVVHQGGNRLVVSEDSLHLSGLMPALFDHAKICVSR